MALANVRDWCLDCIARCLAKPSLAGRLAFRFHEALGFTATLPSPGVIDERSEYKRNSIRESLSSGGRKEIVEQLLSLRLSRCLSADGHRGGWRWLRGVLVVHGTSEAVHGGCSGEPAGLELSDEELAAIQARIDAFKETIEAGDTPEDLVLTAQELNALITQDEDMRGKVFVRIADGEVSGDVSIPTDFLPGGKGRFFNASATFEVSLENGVLIVTLQDAEVKGEKLPQQFIDGMGKENLAKDAYKDPEVAATLRRIESISIENDKIVLKPRVAKSEGEVVEEGAGEGQPATDDSALPKESPESPSNEPPETEAVTPEEAKAPAPAE